MVSRSLANLSGIITGPNFHIQADYEKYKDLAVGTCITSPTFTAGVYDWALDFYPHGDTVREKSNHVSLFFCLKSKVFKEVTAEYSFEVVDKKGYFLRYYSPEVDKFKSGREFWGFGDFLSKDIIEKRHLMNGVLHISCTIKVLTEPTDFQTYPGGLCEQLGELFETRQRSNVIFEVEGGTICAHRFILAARSPVFEAKLYGVMAEAKMGRIKIEEMKAKVFKAMLHFIYTDKLTIASSSDFQTFSVELLQGLFVAADRCALDKLRLFYEELLVINISVETITETLLLADRHSRPELKARCLDFVCNPDNFNLAALTEGYIRITQEAPSLFAELSEKVKSLPRIEKKLRKKRRTH